MSKYTKNISEYCELISKKYNLDPKSLLEDWDILNKDKLVSSEKSEEITFEMVNKSTVPVLSAMCEAKGLKKSGKKDELISRLIECLKKEKNGREEDVKPKSSKINISSKENVPVITSIKKNVSEFLIKKNSFGNYEHLETHLVFNVINNENVVTGVQQENGDVYDLTLKDIDLCNKFKFKYVLPKNLTSSKDLEEIKLDDQELDDQELDDQELDDQELDDEDVEDEI